MTAPLLLIVALVVPGPDDPERAFAAGRYEEALRGFEAALDEGATPRGPLLYGVGSCLFRLGRHAEAVLAWRRAERHLPGDERIAFNIRLAERKLGVAPESRDVFGTALSDLPDRLGPGTLLALVVLVQLVGLVGLVLLRRRAAWRNGMALLVVLGLLGTLRVVRDRWWGPETGVVLHPRVELRAEPHRTFSVAARLPAGVTVEVLEASDRWIRVAHPKGAGWTERAGVGVVRD